MKDASLPITLIIVGLVWLVWHFRLFPDIDWLIALGFIAGGIAVMVFDGINKNSIVYRPDPDRDGRRVGAQRSLSRELVPHHSGAARAARRADADRAQRRHSDKGRAESSK
jgi:hypothetical protein